MTTKRRILLSLSLVVAVVVSVAAATPGAAASAQSFYKRLEILGRMFEIIEMHYVEEVDAEQMFESAVRGMTDTLDPHSRYYTAEEYRDLTERYRGDYHGIGVQFDIFDGVLTVLDALEGGPSAKLGLRPGDQIIAIEGEDAIGLNNDEVYERLRGPRGTQVNVTVRRPATDAEWDVEIHRDQVDVPAVLAASMLDSDIGYVWLQTFSQKGADQLERHLQEFEGMGMRAFILDLRGNRGGLMNQAIRITDKFLDGGKKIVYTEGRTPNANGENVSTDRATHTRVPMIVLVDHGSASASEIVAGALQDWDRALVVGQLTWGKALVQNQFPFNDGSALFLTIARYYTPSGRLIQRPYESGADEDYDNPDWESLEQSASPEEAEAAADAVAAADAERPIFYTAAGRPVRGGGGIMPDVIVKPSGVSRLALWLYRTRLTYQFAGKYVAENAALLPATLEDYLEDFQVDEDLLDEFEGFLRSPAVLPQIEENEVPLDDESLAAADEHLRMYLRAHIASNLWGLEAGRVVLLRYDQQLQEATKLIPQAADLLQLSGSVVGPAAR